MQQRATISHHQLNRVSSEQVGGCGMSLAMGVPGEPNLPPAPALMRTRLGLQATTGMCCGLAIADFQAAAGPASPAAP